MAKFELSAFDAKTGEVSKTFQRNFMPVDLYIRFQQLSEKLDGMKSDLEMFAALKDLFLETFPELTEKEYLNNLDIADVLAMFGDIINKSASITTGNSKNA